MLAHKAVHEGKVAAENTAGPHQLLRRHRHPLGRLHRPEVAWVGVAENEAKAAGVKYGKGVFPWAASGRSLSLGRDEGLTKALFDESTDRVIGDGIVGPNAGDLIAEVAVAIEIGAGAADIGLTIHPHPTRSETVAMSAEAFEGTCPRRRSDSRRNTSSDRSESTSCPRDRTSSCRATTASPPGFLREATPSSPLWQSAGARCSPLSSAAS